MCVLQKCCVQLCLAKFTDSHGSGVLDGLLGKLSAKYASATQECFASVSNLIGLQLSLQARKSMMRDVPYPLHDLRVGQTIPGM